MKYYVVTSHEPAINRVVYLRCDSRKRAEQWRIDAASSLKTFPPVNGNGVAWPVLRIETVTS
jgi:hypothetical protein